VRRTVALFLAWGGAAACAYYNGMWSAEHLAGEARRLERQDRTAEARSYWAQAAVKAESVVARHPKSRWADAALVLQGEALAWSGACQHAAAPLAQADTRVRDEALRERARLVIAQCALEAGDAAAASRALGGRGAVTESRDAGRRSRAALLAGRAAALQGDAAAAAEWFRRSDAPGAAPARVRALLAAGRVAEARALADTVAAGREPFNEEAWAALLADLRGAAGPDTASETLDRMLARRRIPVGPRARLLLADGDALFAAGRPEAATARYGQVAAAAPDSAEGQLARLRAIRVQIAGAATAADLATVAERLQRLAAGGPARAGVADAEGRVLAAVVHRVLTRDELPESRRFRLAEVVRDSLAAPRLAAGLFLELARAAPGSLFAPKALVAAALAWPEGGRRDSILAVLDSAYRGSPYTGALHGALSPAFAAAEDSLARALGLALGPAVPLVASRVPAPVPGPRGPPLDAAAPPAAVATPPGAPPGAPVRRVRPIAGDDEHPSRGQRPVSPRDSL
jgi:predicted negative regulator of RcsB-dependent stress response